MLTALVLYVATACRTVYFGDAGELVTAAASLGVAHPPGYPLWTLLARGALLVPLGEPAFRVALLSAVCGAVACGMTALWVFRVTGWIVTASAAGLFLAFSNVVWASATVPEVYTLHLVSVLALLEAARRIGASIEGARSARRATIVTAAILGVALAHHPTIVLALPSAAVLAWPGRKHWSWRIIAIAALIAMGIPIVAYLSLLPRAAAHPEASWGSLRSLADLIAHATAVQYRSYDLGWTGLLRPDAWRSLGAALLEGTGVVGVFVAVWSVIRNRRKGRAVNDRDTSRLVSALVLLAAVSCLFALRYGVEDVDAYLIPAVAAISILAGLGLRAESARGRLLAGAIAVVMVAVPLARNFPERYARWTTAAADYGRDMLRTLPRDAILIADGDDTFVLAYLQQVLHERADVAIYDRDGFVLRDVVDETGSALPRGENVVHLRMRLLSNMIHEAVAGRRPGDVFFMSLPDVPLPPTIRIDVYGILFRASLVSSPPVDDSQVWQQYEEARVAHQAMRIGGPFAGAVAATYPLMRAEASLTRGDRAVAISETEVAVSRAPRSETVHNAAGTIYGRLGLYDLAIREFEAALVAKPSSARARANLEAARSFRAR